MSILPSLQTTPTHTKRSTRHQNPCKTDRG